MIRTRVPVPLVASVLGLLAPIQNPDPARAQERPTPARLVPAAGLTWLLEYDGIGGAAAEPWRATAAHAVLHDTPTGATISSIARQLADRYLRANAPDGVRTADLAGIADHLSHHGFLLVVDADDRSVMVCPGFGSPAGRALLAAPFGSFDETGALIRHFRFRERTMYQINSVPVPADRPKPKLSPTVPTFWFEGDDLIVAEGFARGKDAPPTPAEGAAPVDPLAAVVDAIEGKIPNAATHPGRLSALAEGRAIAGFVPNGLLVAEEGELDALLGDPLNPLKHWARPLVLLARPGPPFGTRDGANEAEADRLVARAVRGLGTDGVKRVVARWGFRGRALLTAVRFEAPAPRPGLLALLDQPRLAAHRLPPIPADAAGFAVGTLEPARSFATLMAYCKAVDPDSALDLDRNVALLENMVHALTGLWLRADLLDHLGPTWTVFTTRTGLGEMAPVPVPTLLIDLRDRDRFADARVFDSIMARLNLALREQIGPPADGGKPATLAFEPLPAPERGYRLASPAGAIPWVALGIEPTVLLGESHLIVAASPTLARAALAAEAPGALRWAPAGEVAATLAVLPPGLTSLSVGDPGASAWPEALAALPIAARYLGNLVDDDDAEDPAGPKPGAGLRGLLGVPAPGGGGIRIDPAQVPRVAQVRPLLFPSVLATVVDERGLLFLGTEALPFACLGANTKDSLLRFRVDPAKLGKP